MSLLKASKAQLGLSTTATQNFTLTAEDANGTMKLARGNAGATTQDILTVDAAGKVTLNQGSGNLSYTSAVTPLPSAGAVVSVAHGLGAIPAEAIIEMTCLTADAGYAVGDVVMAVSEWNGANVYPLPAWKSATNVGFTLPAAYALCINNKTTGSLTTPTAANWSYRFKLRTA